MPLTAQSAARKDRTTANGGPELQHRHFAFIAATIAEIADQDMRNSTAWHFADACATSNPRFDRRRFLNACNAAQH